MKARTARLDPTEGLDQWAWANAGFTISQMNVWGDHFDHPGEAAPYLHAGIEPVEASGWNAAFNGRYPQMAIAGWRAGWTEEETLEVWGVAFGSHAWEVHASQVPANTGAMEVAELVTEELAGIGLGTEDLIACLFAGLTVDEIRTPHLDGTLDLEAVRVLAALAIAGADTA